MERAARADHPLSDSPKARSEWWALISEINDIYSQISPFRRI
jgi:hypothetical protein